jgi:hypothetical protein
MRYIFAVLFMLLPALCFGYGNHQTLEIINIKASGTGSPAISSDHRIFKAYPGITYSIPVGAIGGKYPYTYSLSNAPSGMAIDSKKGIITWTNPQATANNITVRVTDQDSDYVEATWSITVGTSGFLFVDASTDASGTGTISDPYDTIQDILDLGSSAEHSIVYVRAGTYNIPVHNETGDSHAVGACNLAGNGTIRANKWIGYPGETVEFAFSQSNASNAHYIGSYGQENPIHSLWFENILLRDSWRWGLLIANSNYITVYNMRFYNNDFDTVSGNSGAVGFYPSTPRYNSYIGHSTFDNATDAAFIGSIYETNKLLIEFNTFGTRYNAGADVAIKGSTNYTTVRANIFNGTSTQYAIGSSSSGNFAGCNYNEIVFNYLKTRGGDFNTNTNQGATWVERNTVAGASGWGFRATDYPDACAGPFVFEDNVFEVDSGTVTSQGSFSTEDYYLCTTQTNNSAATSGLIDADGKLLASTYVGTRGWQFADGTTPLEAALGISGGSRIHTGATMRVGSGSTRIYPVQ